ncbi:NAD(P)H-quinone oxidoreductase [Actinospica sp. MGRD01-02]|uniref:NAD(P)H-quinone oxidoreductase n=1 Tax=Actinospica acidithermotolerans TaxID=2828514 RepID=A0A941E986_9ACTN|nr:NAD(P)H-quinone oxidoreductase [Actinospica acidithermotolerans]MBR7828620.1 NAD(P)H-quinone oxidoreductase [Actinospica acidithermotolerans]
MKAIEISEPGGPDVLTWSEVPDPQVRDGEVLIEVAAAAVNRADLMQRQGFYAPPAGASEIPGLECSGRIAALGAGVSGWAVGDEVCALLTGGGYAQKVAAPAGQLLPVPKGVDLVEAAGLPETVCTVWSNVFLTANLQPGETLLVHGGASGIGTTAIQLAKSVGAKVLVTVGSKKKAERCVELGADAAIDYKDEDFVERVRELTDGRGADVILDNIGAKYLARNVDALADSGRLVIIGLQGGARAELDLAQLMYKRGAVIGTALRSRPLAQKAAIVASVREHVWPLVASGAFRVVVDRRVPMPQAADAHRAVEASEHVGKVILVAQ